MLVVESDSCTLEVYQSIAEGAAQWRVTCRGVGLHHQQCGQLVHHPALSHHLHWFKRASKDRAGLLDKFIQSLPTCCRGAADPADNSTENG